MMERQGFGWEKCPLAQAFDRFTMHPFNRVVSVVVHRHSFSVVYTTAFWVLPQRGITAWAPLSILANPLRQLPGAGQPRCHRGRAGDSADEGH
jgi:hypothetical protein